VNSGDDKRIDKLRDSECSIIVDFWESRWGSISQRA